MEHPILEAYDAVAGLYLSIEEKPIKEHDGCWEHQVDERWWVAMNGHQEPKQCSTGESVPPYHIYIRFNDWPAGMLSPYYGSIAAGEAANENAFIAACKAATQTPPDKA